MEDDVHLFFVFKFLKDFGISVCGAKLLLVSGSVHLVWFCIQAACFHKKNQSDSEWPNFIPDRLEVTFPTFEGVTFSLTIPKKGTKTQNLFFFDTTKHLGKCKKSDVTHFVKRLVDASFFEGWMWFSSHVMACHGDFC